MYNDIFDLVMSKKPNLNLQNNNGDTTLMLACK